MVDLRCPIKDIDGEMGENIASTPVITMLLIGSYSNKGERKGRGGKIGMIR